MNSYRILVASSSIDGSTTARVASILENKGHDVICLNTDEVVTGSKRFKAYITPRHTVGVMYDGREFVDDDIDAAWFRRPNLFFYPRSDRATRMSLEREARRAFDSVWGAISADKWLNAPADMGRAQHKITQFAVAASFGFKIPGAIFSNVWDDVRAIGDKSVMKMPHNATLYGNDPDDIQVLYTTVLNEKLIQRIEHASSFPGLFEPYIAKKREWRITVVGDEVFPVAIYTDSDAKDDWRKHQDTGRVSFKLEVPQDQTIFAKCKELLRHYNLRYGAFDFIEKPDGEMVFLEVNPNGQYMWLERELGQPISEAIAKDLVRIAEKRHGRRTV